MTTVRVDAVMSVISLPVMNGYMRSGRAAVFSS